METNSEYEILRIVKFGGKQPNKLTSVGVIKEHFTANEIQKIPGFS